MPRPLRIEYAGAWYHVMNRGSNHQNIYITQDHFILFLNLLADISESFSCEIHAYCLMNNHYHLLIRTPLANLGKAMRHLDGVYTQRFNCIEDRDGPLFRGRYKAILIEEENYLLQVSRYIHLNPVSAKICVDPQNYSWSSYRYYLNNKIQNPWLIKNYILDIICENKDVILYKKYVEDGIDDDLKKFYSKSILQSILGSKEFVEKSIEKLNPEYQCEVRTDIYRTLKLSNLDVTLKCIEEYFRIDRKILTVSTRGKKNYPRMAAIYLLRQWVRFSHKQIADCLTNIQPRAISALLKRARVWIIEDKEFKHHIKNLELLIFNYNKMMYDGT